MSPDSEEDYSLEIPQEESPEILSVETPKESQQIEYEFKTDKTPEELEKELKELDNIKVGRGIKAPYNDPTHALRIQASERASEIMDMRLEGYSLAEIGKKFGVNSGTIHKIIAREVAKSQKKNNQSSEMILSLMDDRLEFMWKALYPQISKGNSRSCEMGLKIMERQAKLKGLDAPEKKQLEISMDLSDAELVAQARTLGLVVPEILASALQVEIIEGEFSAQEAISNEGSGTEFTEQKIKAEDKIPENKESQEI